MSFLAKFRKKSGATVSKPTGSPTPPQNEPVVASTPRKEEEPAELPTPTHPVEINSIFTGLKLSAQVASKESDESPYLQRSVKSEDVAENTPSSFSFLTGSTPPTESPEAKSSFNFIGSDDTPQEETSGFSFLQPESHDKDQESHDTESSTHTHDQPPEIVTEPLHDLQSKSHDKDTESRDKDTTSHNMDTKDAKSHDKESKSHTKSTRAPENKSSPILKPTTKQVPPKKLEPKKKKRKAVRPGQVTKEEASDIDTLSLSSHASSLDGSHYQELLSPDRQPKSHDLPVAQLVKLDSQDDTDTPTDQQVTETPSKTSDTAANEKESVDSEEPSSIKQSSPKTAPTKQSSPPKATPTKQAPETTPTESPDRNPPPEAPPTEAPIQETPPEAPPTETNEGVSEDLTEVFTQPNYSLELSAREKLTMLLEGFQSGLASVRSSRSLEELRTTVSEALSSARGQVEKRKLVAVLRSQQSQALIEEDYELAEQVNQRLEETKLVQEHEIAVSALKAVGRWLSQCCETDQNEITFRGEMQMKMAALQDEQSKALAQLEKEHTSLRAKDKMKLQNKEDTLEREKGHIALDKEHLERREQVLTDEVNRRAADFVSQKESLQEKLTSVKDEISSLEEKLAALKAQKESIVSQIAEQQEKITIVEEELASEKSQLAEEKEAILVREQQLAKQQEELAEEKESLENAHRDLNTSREDISQLVARAKAVTDEFENRVEELKKAGLETEGLLKMVEEGRTLLTPSEKLTSLLARVSSKSSVVDSITSEVLSSQTELSSQRKQLSDLQAQIPQLNDAKKAAVTGRQFKEASRIASEVKTIESKVLEVKGQISDTETLLAELNKKLTQHSEELETLKNETDVQEKDEDKAHLTALMTNFEKLQEVKGCVVASSLSEVVGEWISLYGLLADNLAVKHSWNLDDFKPVTPQSGGPVPSQSEELVTPQSGESVPEPQSEDVCLEEERTPGVGQEETTPTDFSEEIAALEKQIEEMCEVEDYDKAAELQEKLTQLKSK